MRIRVVINGIIEAEMELPEPNSVSAMGIISSWDRWHADQHRSACVFIAKCVEEARKLYPTATPKNE